MQSPLKHIIRLSLLTLLLGKFVACQSWHDAKAVIAEADSLLAKGMIMRDTVALAGAIRALDNHAGQVFAREELAKAYYLMGRNLDDYHHNFADAADYYIEVDRLKTKDLVLRGRINSCMGYLCKQDSCFKEALVFYERSNNSFKASGNEWYYAYNLLNVAEQYVSLREYTKADSILHFAAEYEIDSAYYADIMDLYGYLLFRQQQYDFALTCLLSVKDYSRNINAKSFNYKTIIQIYDTIDCIENAILFANYIIQYSKNPSHRSNAYYVLIQYAKINNDVDLLAKYSNHREDEDRNVRHRAESYAEASQKLKAYLVNPYPYKRITYYICVITILGCSFGGLAFCLYKRYNQTLQIHADTLQTHEQQRVDRCKVFANRVYNHSICFMDVKLWDKNEELRKQANTHIGDIFTRLEDTYHFSDQEIKICLMILLEYSREQMATILRVQPNTISKTKNKIARNLNTTSSQLRDSLIDFLAN